MNWMLERCCMLLQRSIRRSSCKHCAFLSTCANRDGNRMNCSKECIESRNTDLRPETGTNSIQSEFLWKPDAPTVYVHTFGCSHNISDGETMKGVLANSGYNITLNKDEADVWVINTCTVRDKSIQSFRSLYEEAKQKGIKVAIAGCMLEADPSLRHEYSNDAIIGVRQIAHIDKAVNDLLSQPSGSLSETLTLPESHDFSIFSGRKEVPSLHLPKIRRDESVEIIPISLGCKGACTFCQTRLARGDLWSYPIDDILQRIHDCKISGIPEIWLTSEDTGAYGIDRGTNLVELLEKIKEEVRDSTTMIKIGMTNPPFLKPFLSQLSTILNHKNFYSYLHIPVQSGSDAVLKRMNRNYAVSDFISICNFLKAAVPGITLSTDIIVGFPFETEEDHRQSMKLLQDLQLNIVHYSRYYPRPHTIAAKYPQLPGKVVKRRVKELSDWFKGLNPYDELVGKDMVVWVSNERVNGYRCCHTKNYIKVLIDESSSLAAGELLLVHCDEAQRFHVKAKLIQPIRRIEAEYVHPDQLLSSKDTICSFI